jgi:hypothetical protein
MFDSLGEHNEGGYVELDTELFGSYCGTNQLKSKSDTCLTALIHGK